MLHATYPVCCVISYARKLLVRHLVRHKSFFLSGIIALVTRFIVRHASSRTSRVRRLASLTTLVILQLINVICTHVIAFGKRMRLAK